MAVNPRTWITRMRFRTVLELASMPNKPGFFVACAVLAGLMVLGLLGPDRLPASLHSLATGSRSLLWVVIPAVIVASVLGTVLGLATARLGKASDRFTTNMLALIGGFPTIVLIALLLAIYPVPPWWLYVLSLALIRVSHTTKIVRLHAARYRASDVHLAAYALGVRPVRLLLHHVMPGITKAVASAAIASVGIVFAVQSALSFVNLAPDSFTVTSATSTASTTMSTSPSSAMQAAAMQTPLWEPSWGTQIGLAAAQSNLASAIGAAACIAITLLALRQLSLGYNKTSN